MKRHIDPPRVRIRGRSRPCRSLIGAGSLGFAFVLSCGTADETSAVRSHWNFLLIVVDTLRADHLGVYGHVVPTSPRIDEFAKGALVFEAMYSQSPWTKPSIASLFTSLYPPQHLVLKEDTENQLAGSLTTLAEVLQDSGYRTGAISQNPHVQAETGFAQGFSVFHGIPSFQSGVGEMLGLGKQFIDESGEAPFFLYMHFLDPHGPYTPPPKLRKKFLGGLRTENPRIRAGLVGKMLDGGKLLEAFQDEDLRYFEALYDAEIHWVDNAIGQLLDHLAARGLAESTVVILTADHGEEFLDHGTVKHGYHLYEEAVNVPLIVRMPGGRVGRNSQSVVQHVDLMPTVLDIAKLSGPKEIQGRSLRPLLEDPDADHDASAFIATSWRDIDRFAVRQGQWKLVRHEDQGRTELFNLIDDPEEKTDVLAQHSDLAKGMVEAYRDATRRLEGTTPVSAMGERDVELERALEALGYTGGVENDEEPAE